MANRPVIVGVGQLANKDDALVLDPLTLIERSVRRALADAAGREAVAPGDRVAATLLDRADAVLLTPPTVYGLRDAPDRLAAALGLGPGRRRLSGFSGSAPQELLADACDEVAAGRVRVAIVAGGIADASIRRAVRRGEAPPGPQAAPWSQGSDGAKALPDRVEHVDVPVAEVAAGMSAPVTAFAFLESVFAHEAGRSFADQREFLGRLLAPFTRVAARRPDVAWFPVERSPAEIATPAPDNRLVEEPYTKRMVSFPVVDQAAALVVTSEAVADELGIARHRRVYPLAIASCHDPCAPSQRARVEASAALDTAVARAFELAGVGLGDIARFDLYSCFPAAVQLVARALGLPLDDPRGLTVTGGLPYFGGPGAAYVAHSLVCLADECRREPGSRGVAVGLGGMVGKFSVGVYEAGEASGPWRSDRGAEVTEALRRSPVPVDLRAEGEATVLAMTVSHARDGAAVNAPVLAQFDDGRRTGARVADPSVAAALAARNLVGERVRVRQVDGRPVYEPR